jgi:hypothetical protein
MKLPTTDLQGFFGSSCRLWSTSHWREISDHSDEPDTVQCILKIVSLDDYTPGNREWFSLRGHALREEDLTLVWFRDRYPLSYESSKVIACVEIYRWT